MTPPPPAAVCDIVVPVHNSLHLARDLMESLLQHTDVPFRILLMDDASDPYVAEQLRAMADASELIHLERSEENRGFVKTANAGIARTAAPYVCVLNSDTVVTAGWLGRLLRCAESDAAIMVVNPISNAAVNLSVVMPPGYTVHMMADRLAEVSTRSYPDVVTAVGFCLLLKRAALQRWGGFDEVYGMGYCEESDYCMRVTAAGFRVVAADDAFVYHKGESSFVDRARRYAENRRIFDARWDHPYRTQYEAFLARNPLQYLRNRLFENVVLSRGAGAGSGRTSLAYKLWRALGHLGRGHYRVLAARAHRELTTLGQRVKGALAARTGGRRAGSAEEPALRLADLIPEQQPLAYPTPAHIAALPRGAGRLRIVFLVFGFPLSGGVLQVGQLVNRFILEGHDAMIVTLSTEEVQRRLGLLCQPLVYRDGAHLVREFPGADVVVATFWRTAWDWLNPLMDRYRFLPVYYVQDFEPYFYPEYVAERRWALESYGRVPHRVVTSGWLQQRLEAHGWAASKIPLGINAGIYYPRPGRERIGPFTLTAITRPGPEESRRGFEELVKACTLVHREDPSIRFEFFGCEPAAMPEVPFPYVHRGAIVDPEQVARHLSRCDLLVDPSRYQAFGRPGLEAMACGTATVLPDAGGVGEYARDGENTVLFKARDPVSMARAILQLRRDAELRERLVQSGLKAAQAFDHTTEARRHLALYRELLGDR